MEQVKNLFILLFHTGIWKAFYYLITANISIVGGEFNGTINSNGVIFIKKDAVFSGTVNSEVLIVEGMCVGNLNTNCLIVKRTGQLYYIVARYKKLRQSSKGTFLSVNVMEEGLDIVSRNLNVYVSKLIENSNKFLEKEEPVKLRESGNESVEAIEQAAIAEREEESVKLRETGHKSVAVSGQFGIVKKEEPAKPIEIRHEPVEVSAPAASVEKEEPVEFHKTWHQSVDVSRQAVSTEKEEPAKLFEALYESIEVSKRAVSTEKEEPAELERESDEEDVPAPRVVVNKTKARIKFINTY